MESAARVALTYESLYEISLREKQRETLQQVDPDFWRQALSYLREKQSMLEGSRNKVDIFSAAERENVSQQIRNIKRLLHEIYNRREKKIIDIAINKSRTQSKIIDTGNMLDVERQFFESIVNEMNLFRQGLLHNILELLEPSVWLGSDEDEKSADLPLGMGACAPPVPSEAPSLPPDMTSIRFAKDVAQFIGPELEVFGPFKEGAMAVLPVQIADVLVRKGDAKLLYAPPQEPDLDVAGQEDPAIPVPSEEGA